MDVSHSVFCHYLKLKQVQKSQGTENIFVTGQAFTSFQHGFLRSAENIDLHNLVVVVVWKNVDLHNITNLVNVFL